MGKNGALSTQAAIKMVLARISANDALKMPFGKVNITLEKSQIDALRAGEFVQDAAALLATQLESTHATLAMMMDAFPSHGATHETLAEECAAIRSALKSASAQNELERVK